MAEKKNKKQEKKEAKTGLSRMYGTRGRIFQGKVIKKFPGRVVIEMERTVYVHKYERFYKKKSKIHARLQGNLEVNLGDIVRVQECRPLSKIIHAIVISKVEAEVVK